MNKVLSTILKAYINYHTENGGIIYSIGDQSLINTSATNHDFAGVLAGFDAELDDPNHWLLPDDKIRSRVNIYQPAESVLYQIQKGLIALRKFESRWSSRFSVWLPLSAR